jgi:phage-related tail fiber protein
MGEDPSVAQHVGDRRAGVVFVDGVARFIHPYGWKGTAYATNDVGSTTVGRYHPSNTINATTWRWSAWTGLLEDLGAVWQKHRGRISNNTNPNLMPLVTPAT